MIYNTKGMNGEIKINLSPEAAQEINDASSCLVFPFYNDSIVMSYHSKRKGWELPQGGRKNGESPEECAKREAFEETGAILENLTPIGYFTVENDIGEVKTAIFISKVKGFEPKPNWSETGIVKLFDNIPNDISFKDNVYQIIFEYINKLGN